MSPGCCATRSLRMINVGDSRAGVTGLDQLLQRIDVEGWLPADEGLGKRLVTGLRAAGNYVDETAESAYAESLLELYREYLDSTKESIARRPSPPAVER